MSRANRLGTTLSLHYNARKRMRRAIETLRANPNVGTEETYTLRFASLAYLKAKVRTLTLQAQPRKGANPKALRKARIILARRTLDYYASLKLRQA